MAFDNHTYRRALEAQTRRIDDYERVHFRKSYVPKIYDSVPGFEPAQDLRNPERPILQPRVLEFSRATAKAFLQQTESLWLKLDLSRQDATKELLDRKTGSFFVRSSSKAKYALTVRLDENNPPVMHFLVHCNEQGFYIIQGSNLQFVSLYDMLAFFCFQQSGGMPCLLRPPIVKSNQDSYLLESDDSESDDDDEWEETVNSPPSFPKYDEVHFRSPNIQTQCSLQPSTNDPPPPPLPPRRRVQCPYFDVPREMFNHVSRVSSLVDNDTGAIIKTYEKNQSLFNRPRKTMEEPTPPTPSVNEPRSTAVVPVKQAYKNFQILSETNANSVAEHYEMAQIIPVKEVVTPVMNMPRQEHEQPPAIPPKVQPPPIPPKSAHHDEHSFSSDFDPPPPLPPKPKGKVCADTQDSLEPENSQKVKPSNNLGHRRVSSDSSIVSGLSEEIHVSGPTSPPPLPPNHPKQEHSEDSNEKNTVKLEATGEWTVVNKSEISEKSDSTISPASSSGSASAKSHVHVKWKKPRWAKKLKKWRRKPRSKVKYFIIDLSNDTATVFGARVHYYRETVLMSDVPHQKLFSDIRKFMGKMRELLLTDYKVDLLREGMDSCQNVEHLLESALQQCIIQPLFSFLYTRLSDSLIHNGSCDQMKNAVNHALSKSPEELGIRPHLLVPNEKSMQEINSIFNKLKASYNAMRKMEYLLEAVRLTYEGVRDANNPKKTMHDLGADDFLPLFVWVLAHTNFDTAEVEAEYIWGLAHPSLFNGEGGYYLTTLTSAVNVLKESCVDSAVLEPEDLPNMNSLKTQLPIAIQDPITGKISSPSSVPVLPTMTVFEICEIISSQHNIPNPHLYGLYTQTVDKVTKLNDGDCPQEMNTGWALNSGKDSDKPVLVYMKAQ